MRLCATSRKVVGSIPDAVIVVKFPEVDSASNRNEYLEYFLGEILEPQPPGTLMACPDLYRDYIALILFLKEGNNVHTVGQRLRLEKGIQA